MKPIRLLIELDKAGAEWVVCAYASGDARMIDVVESGKRAHAITGNLITGVSLETIAKEKRLLEHLTDPIEIEARRRAEIPEIYDEARFLPRHMTVDQCGKKSNHGLNYRMKKTRFSQEMEIPEADAQYIIDRYTKHAYTNLLLWWQAIERQLSVDRTIVDCFGRKRRFLGEWGEELFKQATAFIPQSTVAYLVTRGMRLAYHDAVLSERWDLLANVHDSLLFQVLIDDFHRVAVETLRVSEYMSAKCSYGGRDFYIKTDVKIGPSWGSMTEVRLTPDIDLLAKNLERAVAGHTARAA